MIRRRIEPRVRELLGRYPVLTLTGPRQSGKTTLCKAVFSDADYVSLEDPDARAFATSDPRGFLAQFPDRVILDEVQRTPELPSYLQGIVDADPRPGRFILTGSQHFGLMEGVSQSLAGRAAILTLLPLSYDELRKFPNAPDDLFQVLVGGSYPAVYDRNLPPTEWLSGYVQTYLERDVRQILNVTDLATFQTFLGLCAAHTAQLVNLSELGGAAGITYNTAKAWLSVLETSFVIHRLPPFVANVRKRLIKTPKLHFLDSGLACYLLGIRNAQELVQHPLRGFVFESWVISEIMKAHHHEGVQPRVTFYRDQSKLEIDALVEAGPVLKAVEIKSARTVASDFFRALDECSAVLSRAPSIQEVERILVWGGDKQYVREGTLVLPWKAVSEHDWVRP